MKKTFQETLRELTLFWEKQGCIIHQGYDLEVGAGTFNPTTFLRSLGPEPYRAAYVEPSRRPSDGRFGENPIRFQHYFQYQVILKPSPDNILDLYLQSLEAIGFDLSKHDIRFVHDDWESPSLGASGLGWEVWMDGMEVTQFTYFQIVGGQEVKPVTGEITYGIERLATFLQGVDSTFDLQWNDHLKYGDIYKRNEFEWSHYNFYDADVKMWFNHFQDFEKEAKRLLELKRPLPAYDFVLKSSHAFNILDARGAISVSERSSYIARLRDLSRLVATTYIASREEQGFPLLNHLQEKKEENKALPSLSLETLPNEKRDFLLEIGVEELPATFVQIGIDGLNKGIEDFLKKENISYTSIETFGTPRRLALIVKEMALETQPKITEKKGPAVIQAFDQEGKITQIGEGFIRNLNIKITHLNDLKNEKLPIEIRSIQGNDYLIATIQEKSQSVPFLLQKELAPLILKMDFPKKMRWGSSDITFARPIRWIVALLNETILPFQLGNVQSGRMSKGHRLLANDWFEISKSSDYVKVLREHQVLASMEERKDSINRQLDLIEKELQGEVIAREKVISQVLNLVEWPTLTSATFDERYLNAPKEILISEMVEHQKYFPVVDKNGDLKNVFIITSNTIPTDLIRKGNQKVLSARLFDGSFLYEQDLKVSLDDFLQKLTQVTYLQGLGTIKDKTERLKKHAKTLLKFLPIADPEKVIRAAELSKFDLVTGVVYEFPELQGTMGKIYALKKGEDPEIALSIEEHWMPKGENASLPETPTGIILSLSDKLDNLISCFGMNLKPSSSSDPFALRRQVLGLIRILIQGHYHLPLKEVLSECVSHFPSLKINNEELIRDITQFILQRIKSVFLSYQLSKEDIEASLSSGFNDIFDIFSRISALSAFRKTGKEFPQLLEVYKRAKGQLSGTISATINPQLLVEPAEKTLFHNLEQVESNMISATNTHNYTQAYAELASLQPLLSNLFDQVKILSEDEKLKENRLAILQRVFHLFGKLVDFNLIK